MIITGVLVMPKRKTQGEFEKEILSLFPNIEVLGRYFNSSTPVLFRCKRCGHEWNQEPNNLLHSHGCTICSGAQYEMKTREAFISELSQINPDIIVIGDYLGNKKPIMVKCVYCEHIWSPKPNNLLSGHGCPRCAKRRAAEQRIKKQESVFLEKIKAKNPFVFITSEYAGSQRPISLRCLICNYNWETTPEALLCGQSCPACYEKAVQDKKADLELITEEKKNSKPSKEDRIIASEGGTTVGQITAEEERQKKLQIAAERTIKQEKRAEERRLKKEKAIEEKKQNSLDNKVPQIASEWNYERNYPLTPKDVHYNANKKVWWRCRFGHEYECRISDRVSHGTGCKKCAKRYRISLREHTFLYYIKKYFPDVIPSYQPNWLKRKELDAFIPSLMVGIEYDGQFYHVNDRDIEKLCDKVAIIKDGVLIKHGTMEEVRGDASLESVFLELEGTGLEGADE